MGMEIKGNWQVYPIQSRGVTFLSYRFFHHKTILRKPLMRKIKRVVRRVRDKKLTYHRAASIVSYMGILKHCDSRRFKQKYVFPYVRIKICKGVIRNETRRIQCLAGAV